MRRLKWHWGPPPEAFPAHCQPLSYISSPRVLWSYDSIIPFLNLWSRRVSEYPAHTDGGGKNLENMLHVVKCPSHYEIIPFTFHINRDYIILLTVSKRKVSNGSTTLAHIHVGNMKEEILPNYTYRSWGLWRRQGCNITGPGHHCVSASHNEGRAGEGRQRN